MDRNVLGRLFIGAMLVQALAACENRCDRAAVPGTYAGTVNGVELEVTLTPDGRGAVKSSENVSGVLTWTLSDVESQQLVELEGEGDAVKALAALTAGAGTFRAVPGMAPQTYGPSPVCGRAGRMESLVFSFDEGIELRRVR